eukprot:6172355-Pleurochrysis_carterae.AAC.1
MHVESKATISKRRPVLKCTRVPQNHIHIILNNLTTPFNMIQNILSYRSDRGSRSRTHLTCRANYYKQAQRGAQLLPSQTCLSDKK